MPQNKVFRVVLAVLVGLLLGCLAAEAGFRVGIACHVSMLRNPSLYCDFEDSDYWKLLWEWMPEPPKRGFKKMIHPLLGWSQVPPTPDNPLGLAADTLRGMASRRPKILFYGDSFVKGAADPPFSLPRCVEAGIKGVDVVDLSVGGYGLDQIYLLLQQTSCKVPGSLLLVGIYMEDPYRSMLQIRSCQKPYFALNRDGNIELAGVPVDTDPERFVRNYHMALKSYFVSFLRRRLPQPPPRGDTKMKMVNAQLLELMKASALHSHSRLVVVLLYDVSNLRQEIWVERFLKNQLRRLNVPYVDSKPWLLRYAQVHHSDLMTSFYDTNPKDWYYMHHNNLGNQVIAGGILTYLRQQKYLPIGEDQSGFE